MLYGVYGRGSSALDARVAKKYTLEREIYCRRARRPETAKDRIRASVDDLAVNDLAVNGLAMNDLGALDTLRGIAGINY